MVESHSGKRSGAAKAASTKASNRVDQEKLWLQGAQAAVAHDMEVEIESAHIAQVFGPMDSDKAQVEVKTSQGTYQVIVAQDGSFTIF